MTLMRRPAKCKLSCSSADIHLPQCITTSFAEAAKVGVFRSWKTEHLLCRLNSCPTYFFVSKQKKPRFESPHYLDFRHYCYNSIRISVVLLAADRLHSELLAKRLLHAKAAQAVVITQVVS